MLKVACLTLTLLLSNLIGPTVQDISSIKDLKQKISFDLYVPTQLQTATNYEIKWPEKDSVQENDVLINYFNKDNDYVFGVNQKKNNSFIEKEIVTIDIKDGTEISRKVNEKVELKPFGERVVFDGKTGWYVAYKGAQPTGGYLTWVQEDTYIEINSYDLSKSSLIEVAKSMVNVRDIEK